MASKRRRVIQAEDSSEEHRPLRRGSSPSREQSQQATSASDQDASGSDQDSSEHSSEDEDSSEDESDEDSSDQEGEEEDAEEGSEDDEGSADSDDSKAKRKARKKRVREKREKLRYLQTNKATVQDNENVDLPYNPDKKFERQFGQPMVELKAGSNVWYQAYIIKESANEVKVKVPGVNGKRKALIEWLRKGSSRIWRGSLKQEHWKHLGKGSWKPKATAFSTIKGNRASRGGNGGTSSARRRSAQRSGDQHLSGASVGCSTEQHSHPTGNGRVDEEVMSPRPQQGKAEGHTLLAAEQQEAMEHVAPASTEDATVSDEAGAGRQDSQHAQPAVKSKSALTNSGRQGEARGARSSGRQPSQKLQKGRPRLLLEPRPSMSDADHASTHSQHVAESPGLLADQNSTRALSSIDDAGFEQQRLALGAHSNQAAAAHAILAHHQQTPRHHQHTPFAGLGDRSSTPPASLDPLACWFLQHMTALAATGTLGALPDSSMEAGGLPDGFAYNLPTRQVVRTDTTPGSEPAQQAENLPQARKLQPAIPPACSPPASAQAAREATAAYHGAAQGKAGIKDGSKGPSLGTSHLGRVQSTSALDVAREAVAGGRQRGAPASPQAAVSAPASGLLGETGASAGVEKAAGVEKTVSRGGGPVNGSQAHVAPGSRPTGSSQQPALVEGKLKEVKVTHKPSSRSGPLSPRDSPAGGQQGKQASDKLSPTGNGISVNRPPAGKSGQPASHSRGSEGGAVPVGSKSQPSSQIDRWPSSDVKLNRQDSLKTSPPGAASKPSSRPAGPLGNSSKPSSPAEGGKPAGRPGSQHDNNTSSQTKHSVGPIPPRSEANSREERDAERGRSEGGAGVSRFGAHQELNKPGGGGAPIRRPAGPSGGGADPGGSGITDRHTPPQSGWDVKPTSRPGSMGGARPNNSVTHHQPGQSQGQQGTGSTPGTSPSPRAHLTIPPPPPPPHGPAPARPPSQAQPSQPMQPASSPCNSRDGTAQQTAPTATSGKTSSKDCVRSSPFPHHNVTDISGADLQRSVQLQLPPPDERRFKSGGSSSRGVSPLSQAPAAQGDSAARSSFGGFGGSTKATGHKRPGANISSGGAGPPSKGLRRSVIMADDSDEDNGPYSSSRALGSPQPSVVTDVQGGLEARNQSVGGAAPAGLGTAVHSQGGAGPWDVNGGFRPESEERRREEG